MTLMYKITLGANSTNEFNSTQKGNTTGRMKVKSALWAQDYTALNWIKSVVSESRKT